MKRLPINKIDVAIIAAIVILIILVIFISGVRYGTASGCPLRPFVMLGGVDADIIAIQVIAYTEVDSVLIGLWPNGSQFPKTFASGICYVASADELTTDNLTLIAKPSDNLTLRIGQYATCYFDSTEANGGISPTPGQRYRVIAVIKYDNGCRRVERAIDLGPFITSVN